MVIGHSVYPGNGFAVLLAHGLGTPVADAATEIKVAKAGTYRVWVRTKDWVARWKAAGTPGRFKLSVQGKALQTEFGIQGEKWDWQDGGTVDLKEGTAELRLQDQTGFDGRSLRRYLAYDRSTSQARQ